MSQGERLPDLAGVIGYQLKRAATTLRARMDHDLREFELSVPQFACLELLGQRPGLSNADLARGAFVTRQSMNLVLRGLQDRGLVTRPEQAEHGRARPTELTHEGRALLLNASSRIADIERRMTESFTPAQQAVLLDGLRTITDVLG